MIEPTTDQPPADAAAADDQRPVSFGYGRGRMPGFLKAAWLAALAFIAWYVVRHLLPALAQEMSGLPG